MDPEQPFVINTWSDT